jgi:hypothetical protein
MYCLLIAIQDASDRETVCLKYLHKFIPSLSVESHIVIRSAELTIFFNLGNSLHNIFLELGMLSCLQCKYKMCCCWSVTEGWLLLLSF